MKYTFYLKISILASHKHFSLLTCKNTHIILHHTAVKMDGQNTNLKKQKRCQHTWWHLLCQTSKAQTATSNTTSQHGLVQKLLTMQPTV